MKNKIYMVLFGMLFVSLMVSTASASVASDNHKNGIRSGYMAAPTSNTGLDACTGCHAPLASFCNGCHNFPVFSLSVVASPTSVLKGSSTDVSFTVKQTNNVNSSNKPAASGATVTLSGAGVSTSGTTDAAGIVTKSLNPTIVGTINADATMSGFNNGTATVSVTEPVVVPVLTTITVSPATANINIGATQTFAAAPKDQTGLPMVVAITWTSSNTTVGNVDASGKFTALAAGIATVKAENGTVNGTATVTVTINPPKEQMLAFAITPSSRNAQLGTPVTIFMSVINSGTTTATGVSIAQATNLPATVSYQQWNSTSAMLIGAADTPVDMAAGTTTDFVLTINATSTFNSSSMTFNVSGTNALAAPISAVNTLTISAGATPSADVIMISTNLNVSTPVNNSAFFALATMNVGGASATGVSLVVSVPSSITGLAYQVNQTNSTTGAIIGSATGLTIAVGAQPTFAVFLTPTKGITNDPANNRITLKLIDGSGKVIGAQSVAIYTT